MPFTEEDYAGDRDFECLEEDLLRAFLAATITEGRNDEER